MAKKIRSRLAEDLIAGLEEVRDHFAGKKTGVIVHRVTPSASAARKARLTLGLSRSKEDVIVSRQGKRDGRTPKKRGG